MCINFYIISAHIFFLTMWTNLVSWAGRTDHVLHRPIYVYLVINTHLHVLYLEERNDRLLTCATLTPVGRWGCGMCLSNRFRDSYNLVCLASATSGM